MHKNSFLAKDIGEKMGDFFYVYCSGVLGVKTNVSDFKWIYGSAAPKMSLEEYEKCTVKFDVRVKPEKKLSECGTCDQQFQSFIWDSADKSLFYRRSVAVGLRIGYNIKIDGNTVRCEIGETYWKLVKNRTMNLHGIYYLLSDLANVMLLDNGFLTLYASSVYFKTEKRGVVCFAAPNTGKTLTAVKLCDLPECSLLGEDVVITDGELLYSCPWTSSYRGGKNHLDTAGAFGRRTNRPYMNVCECEKLTDLVVLTRGTKKISTSKEDILRQICILNGYLFVHFSSPIVKVLGFFDPMYDRSWSEYAKAILEKMVKKSKCYGIYAEKPLEFWEVVRNMVSGEII